MAEINKAKYEEGKELALNKGTLLSIVEAMPDSRQGWSSDEEELNTLSFIVGFGDGVLQILRDLRTP